MLLVMALLAMAMVVVNMLMMAVMMGIVVQVRMTRIFAEDKGFDRYRHSLRRHTDTAEVNVIEISQHYAVDG